MAHRYWQGKRVVKMDSKDGKTEWFLIGIDELKIGMDKLSQALHYMFNDKLVWNPKATNVE
jgi:hypothetical protein